MGNPAWDDVHVLSVITANVIAARPRSHRPKDRG